MMRQHYVRKAHPHTSPTEEVSACVPVWAADCTKVVERVAAGER